MKQLLLISFFTISNFISAQTTAIPDVNFEQELINLGLDVALDGQVLTANIDTVTSLFLNSLNISDLSGLQDFIALSYLDCDANQLTSLNITQNAALNSLHCSYNQLTSLDITQNTVLIDLWTRNNQLTTLDVTQNTALTYLNCFNNQLTTLDVSQNTALDLLWCSDNQLTNLNLSLNVGLTNLYCDGNQLTCLNVKNGFNTFFIDLWTNNNPSLICIEVDNVVYSNTNWTLPNFAFDPASSFSISCPNSCAVGIDELTSSSINFYPNPTTGQLSIYLEETSAANVTIRNSLGQLMLSDNRTSTNKLKFDISSYPTGIYFLQLAIDGEVITKKIIKQ